MKLDTRAIFEDVCSRALAVSQCPPLRDEKMQEIAQRVGPYGVPSDSQKCHAQYFAMRSAVVDRLASEFLCEHPDATVLNLGCGLDSKALRLEHKGVWFDLDAPEMIDLRREFYEQDALYRMVPAELSAYQWIDSIPKTGKPVLIIAQDPETYFTETGLWGLVIAARCSFESTYLIFDARSSASVRREIMRHPFRRAMPDSLWGIDGVQQLESYAPGVKCTAVSRIPQEEYIAALDKKSAAYFRRKWKGKNLESRLVYAAHIPGGELFKR